MNDIEIAVLICFIIFLLSLLLSILITNKYGFPRYIGPRPPNPRPKTQAYQPTVDNTTTPPKGGGKK